MMILNEQQNFYFIEFLDIDYSLYALIKIFIILGY